MGNLKTSRELKKDFKPIYTKEERMTIEKLAKSKGTVYNTPEEAKKHIRNL